MMTYPVADKHMLRDFMEIIETETGIPVSEQELLLASGTSADPNSPAMLCLPEVVSEQIILSKVKIKLICQLFGYLLTLVITVI